MSEVVDFKGIKVACRPNSTDKNIAICIIGMGEIDSDEYHIRKLAEAGGVFVDIGAYGAHASLLAAQLGMECIAVEPLPENLENLQLNLGLNPELAKKIKVVPAAVGRNLIYWNDPSTEFSKTHRFVAQNKPSENAQAVVVPMVDLDILLENYEYVTLMKTDCEGGEWAIAESAAKDKVLHIVGEFHKLDDRTFEDFRACFPHHDDVSAEFGDGHSVDGINRLFVFRLDTI